MAVQFWCPNCNKALEVDDHLASQLATCPYCQTVVRVPNESELAAPPATPVTPPLPTYSATSNTSQPQMQSAPPLPTYIHVQSTNPERQKIARKLAKIALAISVLTLIGFAVNTCIQFVLMHEALPNGIQIPRDVGEQKVMQEQMTEATEKIVDEHPEIGIAQVIIIGLAWIALVLAVVSLSIARTWQGWVSIVLCLPMTLCVCCGGIMMMGM